jgi:hypothetical protein
MASPKKKYLLVILLVSLPFFLYGQELRCNIQLVTQQIQGTNKQIFQTLQTAMYEFMNNRNWTNHVYEYNERIECTILINLTEQLGADEFRGTIQIQSSRPAYNSTYNSTMFNFRDNDFRFRYIEFERLEFNEQTHLSNLTSVLAFYAYIIIGLDYDSFSAEGGTPYFQKAEAIVNNAQNVVEPGWKPYDGARNRNRYWLIKNILDDEYRPIRQFLYRYHRLGLDLMDSKVNEGRAEIAESVRLLQEVYRQKPDPYLFLLQLVFDAKADEFVNVFSDSFPEEKRRVVTILREIDPANSSKYDKIME